MSAILLAATQRDGHEVMRAARYVPEPVTIVTPRSVDLARGMSVTHIFRTPSFVLLDDNVREKVERVAAPAIATSNCPFCSTLLEHQALDRKAGGSE